jgi:Spy/CpxP family protein refolding chaperone
MKKLQAANSQFEKQRGDLMLREREVRRELRQQIVAGDKANQNRVAQLLDQTMVLERQRLDLVQNEQRELAKFLTPVQRAKLFGLQNELV